jgi:hypothetical protein
MMPIDLFTPREIPPELMVRLKEELVARCEDRGYRMVRYLKAGGSPRTTAMATHGAENDPDLQARSKMAECATCILLGGDVDRDIHWADWADPGFDCKRDGFRYDCKMIPWHYHYLCWAVAKNPWFERANFHRLVLVKEKTRGLYGVRGWVDKDVFAVKKHIAGPGHKLDLGTWHMDEQELEDALILINWRKHLVLP